MSVMRPRKKPNCSRPSPSVPQQDIPSRVLPYRIFFSRLVGKLFKDVENKEAGGKTTVQ